MSHGLIRVEVLAVVENLQVESGGVESVGEITDLFTDCCHGLFWPACKILAGSFSPPMDLWLEVSILGSAPSSPQ